MIPNNRALVPLGRLEYAVMAAIASVEDRRTRGMATGENPWARAFFRSLTGQAGIDARAVQQVEAGFMPGNRISGRSKNDYIVAIDRLIGSGGEICLMPLGSSTAGRLFPGVRARTIARQEHHSEMHCDTRRKATARQEADAAKGTAALLMRAGMELKFMTPGTVKAWYKRWNDRWQERDLNDNILKLMVMSWWAGFIVLRNNTCSWGWDDAALWEVMGDIHCAAQEMADWQHELCRSATPVWLTHY